MKLIWVVIFVLLPFLHSTPINITTFGPENISGTSFSRGDIITYDRADDSALLAEPLGEIFSSSVTVDALSHIGGGAYLLSSGGNTTFTSGGSFDAGDIGLYNSNTNSGSIFVAESTIFDDGDGNINSVSFEDNDNILISFVGATEVISGTSFGNGDIVRYTISTDSASLVVGGATIFDSGGNITGISKLDNDTFLINTSGLVTINGASFSRGDVIHYTVSTDTASLFAADSTIFDDGNANIMAITRVPEPSTYILLCILSLFTVAYCRYKNDGK